MDPGKGQLNFCKFPIPFSIIREEKAYVSHVFSTKITLEQGGRFF